jgi:hypothetical protein
MYFLYILQELQKKHNITLELEIIKLIYNYLKYICILEKYNLFELINMLKKSGLTCIMNKKSIIDKFIINKLYINHNFDNTKIGINYVKCRASNTVCTASDTGSRVSERDCTDSRFTYSECLYKKKLYCFIINDINGKEIMQIHNDDIINFDDNTYIINMYSKMYQNYMNKHAIINFVKLKNLKTNKETNFTNIEFINLFINKNITITYINSFMFNNYNHIF